MKKQKENSHENISWSEMGKQNEQAKKVHFNLNCVNNKMLEYDWLLTALVYGLIGCFRFELSDLTCPITNICNRTGQIGQLSSQKKN